MFQIFYTSYNARICCVSEVAEPLKIQSPNKRIGLTKEDLSLSIWIELLNKSWARNEK